MVDLHQPDRLRQRLHKADHNSLAQKVRCRDKILKAYPSRDPISGNHFEFLGTADDNALSSALTS